MKGASDLLEAAQRLLGRGVEVHLVLRDGTGATRGGDEGGDWIDQHDPRAMPTARLHCAAVRRRMSEGKPGATIKGRRHLLTREALDEEMLRCPKPGLRKTRGLPSPEAPGRGTVAETVAQRLRSIRSRG